MEEIKLTDDLTIYRGKEEEIDFFEMFFVFSKHNTQKYFTETIGGFKSNSSAMDKIRSNFVKDYVNKSFANYNKFERVIKKDMFSSFLNREDVKQNLKRVFIKDSNKNYVEAKDDERDTTRELFVYKDKYLLSIEGIFKRNDGTLIPYCSYYASSSLKYQDYLPYQRGITATLFHKEIVEILPLTYQQIARVSITPTHIYGEGNYTKQLNVDDFPEGVFGFCYDTEPKNVVEKDMQNKCVAFCEKRKKDFYISEYDLIRIAKDYLKNEGLKKEDYENIVNNDLFDLNDNKTKQQGFVL